MVSEPEDGDARWVDGALREAFASARELRWSLDADDILGRHPQPSKHTVRRRVSAALVAALILLVFFVPLPRLSLFNRITTSSPSTSPHNSGPVIDLAATPPGWVPVAYGDAQLSVPASWRIIVHDCMTIGVPVPGVIGVNPLFETKTACRGGAGKTPRTTVLLLPSSLGARPGVGRAETINHILVYAVAQGSRFSPVSARYLVPALGVEIILHGPLGQRVLHTLTWSPRAVVFAEEPAQIVPSSWQSVSFDGVSFSVPASWPVLQTTVANQMGSPCGMGETELSGTSPEVSLSTDSSSTWADQCPAPLSLVARAPDGGVDVDTGANSLEAATFTSFSRRCIKVHGLGVCPATSWPYSVLALRVTVPRAKPVYMAIGLAGNGTVARTILYSLRPASSSDSCPGNEAYLFAPGELFGVQFLSVTKGWVVGSNEILATDDGGAHWTAQYRARCADLIEVDFVDAEQGWAVGLTNLLATTDGGKHWQQLHEPVWPVRSVQFVSPTVGYAIGGGNVLIGGGSLGPWRNGVVLKTVNGGRSWALLASPAGAQSVCFSTPDEGLLGADGHVYRSLDGGGSWSLVLRGYKLGKAWPFAMVQCSGQGAGWAELDGPGGEMSQTPHVAYYSADGHVWVPIFAERYFPYPGLTVSVNSPGTQPGPFGAINAVTAVFVEGCIACGQGTAEGSAPWAIAKNGGKQLLRLGDVGDLTTALGVSFVSSRSGWVTGTATHYRPGGSSTVYRLVHTSDSGRTWKVEYAS